VSALYQDKPDVKKYFGALEKSFSPTQTAPCCKVNPPFRHLAFWMDHQRPCSASGFRKRELCRFRCVLFDTGTGRVAGRFCPTPVSGPRTPSPLRRSEHEKVPRTTIIKYIVYTSFLMIGRRWPAPAVVRSGFADPSVGMVIAVAGPWYFPPRLRFAPEREN
jgi:hypothetical protein